MALQIVSNPQSKATAIKSAGVNTALLSTVPAKTQQANAVRKQVSGQTKGENLSILISNSGNTREAFILFDKAGLAAAAGAPATGGDVTFTTSFAGGLSYTSLINWLKTGAHLAVVGTMFEFGNETDIQAAGINIWNGNLEEYNKKSLQNYLTLGKDTYAQDPKTIIMNTAFWVNGFFAITGTVPAAVNGTPGTLNLLFNVPAIGNF